MKNNSSEPAFFHGAENIAYVSLSVVILITVLLGFARSYFLAGVFLAPLPSLLVHLHAAAMSCWIFLFIAQAALIANGRAGLHRRLGLAGTVLAGFIVISGVVFACVRRGGVPPFLTKNLFLVNNVLNFPLFGILVGWAILVLFDLVRIRMIHLATLGGGALSLALDPISVLAAGTGLVQNITAWLTRPG